jgi:hypothetical protein
MIVNETLKQQESISGAEQTTVVRAKFWIYGPDYFTYVYFIIFSTVIILDALDFLAIVLGK